MDVEFYIMIWERYRYLEIENDAKYICVLSMYKQILSLNNRAFLNK